VSKSAYNRRTYVKVTTRRSLNEQKRLQSIMFECSASPPDLCR